MDVREITWAPIWPAGARELNNPGSKPDKPAHLTLPPPTPPQVSLPKTGQTTPERARAEGGTHQLSSVWPDFAWGVVGSQQTPHQTTPNQATSRARLVPTL